MAPHEVNGWVSLRWVCANVPDGDGYERLDDLDSPAARDRLADAARKGESVWLELGIPEHDEIRSGLPNPDTDDAREWALRAQDWLQGTLDAWAKMPVPIVDWSNVAPVLETLGLTAPQTPTNRKADSEVRFLEALPHLYGRGVARTQRELLGSSGSVKDMYLFPTVGFLKPEEEPDPTPEFWTVRVSVGVVRKVVVTVRLPDALCSGERPHPEYRTGVASLTVKQRYLPFGRDASEQDIAEGIGIHQAATLQAVVETLRERLICVEKKSRELATNGRDPSRKHAIPVRDQLEGLLENVVTLTETAHQLDRHVASVLRRFGDFGKSDDELVPKDIRLRYGFAIDQLTSLREELRLVRSALSDRISTAEQQAREQFQGLAALIASAILVPGLLAAIYSTDVKLPAENTWPGFAMLLLIIIGVAIFGVWIVIKLQPHADVVEIRDGIKRRMPIAALGAVLVGVAVAVFVPLI